MPPLQLLIKPASGSCNLRCKYCFYCDEMEKREVVNFGMMSEETLEAVVKKALDFADGFCGFAFQGGEPTLVGLPFFYKLLEFQARYNHKNVTITNSIQTNGTRLTPEWAQFLAKHHFLTGISLDGIKHTHDALRLGNDGKGTFGAVMEATRLLKEAGAEFNILTVVNRLTATKVDRIYNFYKKNGFDYLQFIACLDPLGEEPGSRDYSLTPQDYGQFLIRLFDLWYLDLQKGKQPYIRMFENYIALLLGQEPESCEQRGVCSIQFVTEADGSVYPCDFYVLDPYKMGNFREDTVEEMAKKGRESHFLDPSLTPALECRMCPYLFLCRGGCRRNRTELPNGELGLNYFCPSYRAFFDACLPRMRQIASNLLSPHKERSM